MVVGPASLVVGRARAAEVDLAQGDAVQGRVDLAVAAAREAIAGLIGGPDRHGRRAVVASEGSLRSKARDSGGLADDLGRGQRAASGQIKEARSQEPHSSGDLGLELVYACAQRRERGHELSGDPGHDARPIFEGRAKLGLDVEPAKGSSRRLGDAELMEVPAQPALDLGSSEDEVLAMIDEQLDVPIWSI